MRAVKWNALVRITVTVTPVTLFIFWGRGGVTEKVFVQFAKAMYVTDGLAFWVRNFISIA
jgi:hypothetical protein